MRFVTTLKILVFIVIATLLAIFYIQNTGRVAIQFPFGRPYQFRFIYILLTAFATGVVTALFITFMITAKIKKKMRSEESKDLVDEE